MALALLAALAAAGCGRGTDAGGPARRSALLVTLDTTRADALGCYGGLEGATPNLDRLAREGVLFERAHTAAPITLPAHAAMLCGLYPPRSGVRQNGVAPLPQSARTLAERAREAGFQTAAFVAAVVLDAPFGLDQGFERYDVPAPDPARGASSHFDERPAGEVVDAALAWLAARDRERPFFLWVHLFDPHAPYLPPPAFRGPRYGDNAYIGEVGYADAQLGRLLDALRAEGALEETTTLVVGDHGEAFGEHDELSHGVYCYEPTLRVPFLLRLPDGRRAGTRSAATVSVVDVHPTLAAAMGLGAAAELDGVDLFAGDPPAERGVYFESYYGWYAYGWSPIAGWLDAAGKYLHSSAPELYELATDPGETRDRIAARDPRPYRDAIAALAARPELSRGDAAGVDAALQRRIQALGYAGVEDAERELPHPLARHEQPAPASMRGAFRALMLGVQARNEGRWADAEARAQEALAIDPQNPSGLELLGTARIQRKDWAGAIAPFQALLRAGEDRATVHYNLAISLWQVGRLDEAAEGLKRALELAPGERRVLQSLVQVLRAAGRADEADAYARELAAGGGG